MGGVRYIDPEGKVFHLPLAPGVLAAIGDADDEYWKRGSGSLCIEHESGSSLLVMPRVGHGVYLKLFPGARQEEMLSLHDRSRFSEWVECEEGWYASAGLFVPPDLARSAVEDFAQSGGPTTQIDWIRPSELPEEANW